MLAFATPQEVANALDMDRQVSVWINGILTDAIAATADHDVDQPVGQGSLSIPLPRPAHVVPNAEVEIQAGYNNFISTVFRGTIPARDGAMTRNGWLLDLDGEAAKLARKERYELRWPGPITLRDLFIACCERCGVTSYIADETTHPDGVTPVLLGGNPGINNGDVVLRAGSTELILLQAYCKLYGYRVFEIPGGILRLQRISGTPTGAPVVHFVEPGHGLDGGRIIAVRRGHDVTEKINYWHVMGPDHEDPYGAVIPISSKPLVVPNDPEIPGGYRYEPLESGLIATQVEADAIRNVMEIDHMAASTPVTVDAVGIPGIVPGDVVRVTSPMVEASGQYWLMGTRFRMGQREGYLGTYRCWAGGGVPLPGVQDKVTITLQTTPIHLGDEYLSHYAHPSPQGKEWSWTFTVPERAAAVNFRFLAHGCNSQLSGGANTDLEVSKFELWRPDNTERPVSSGNLPVMNEDLLRRPDYSNLANWSPAAVNLRGTEAGEVTLKLKAGVKFGVDDFEITQLVAEVYGTVEPTLPGEVS